MKDKIKLLVSKKLDKIIEIRRYLHQNPELSFQEYKTSEYISKILTEYGINHQTGVVKTGIVGTIEGRNPTSKTIALRADIDALPIKETTGLSFRSINEGVMHACGHDVHTSSLIGSLIILNALKDTFEGTVKFLFQPGEELLPGGAKLMIEEGVLEKPKVERIIGQHVYPDLEVGQVGFKSGTYMASADEIYFTVKGKGGHAALPHQTIDPILITSHIIIALQQIVSRNASPYIPSVLSFGDIEGKGATNIIPSKVKVKGTFRTFDEEWRNEAHFKMVKMAELIAESMGGECDFEVRKGYPVLINDAETTKLAKQTAIEYLGETSVIDLGLRMTAEDFAYYSQETPACFYRVGTSNAKKKIGGSLHNGSFMIDEQALKISTGLMAYIAIKQLENMK
jgi:amidohydrolase